jgi:hypothetical protein
MRGKFQPGKKEAQAGPGKIMKVPVACKGEDKSTMNCQEFQEVLPYIIESGGNPSEAEHLRTCHSCAELVRDLRYIAEQAKLLLPMREPSPQVWNNIEQSLQREGMLTEGRMSPPGQITNYSTAQAKSWTPLGFIISLVATMFFANMIIHYRQHLPAPSASAQNGGTQSVPIIEDDDQQLVSTLSKQDVAVGNAYQTGLQEANAYIADAKQAVNRDPLDQAARQQLVEAYQQKEMVYQMATTRSLP